MKYLLFIFPAIQPSKPVEWWFPLLTFLIILSLLSVIIFFLLSLNFNFKKTRFQAVSRKYELIFTEIVIRYIYFDLFKDSASIGDYFSSLRNALKNKKLNETFFSVIIRIQEMIDEDLSEKLNVLVENTLLKKRIIWFLNHGKLNEKIVALKIIGCLKMKGYDKVILKYSGSRNYILRSAALITLIKLSEKNHLDMLLSHKHLLSNLDINIIINEVEKNRKYDIDYQNLISSQSPRVNAIGLILIKTRNKIEFKDSIKPLLEIKDDFLHEIAWKSFTSFAGKQEDLLFMEEKFNTETTSVKMLIIRTLRFYFQNGAIYVFLDKVIRNESVLLKIEALRILFDINIDRFLSYKGSPDNEIAVAYNELVDLNLS